MQQQLTSPKEELIHNILSKPISFVTTHDYHLFHPNSIQWSKNNVIAIIHGQYIDILDIKLLFQGQPLQTVIHQSQNDLLSGINGKLSTIHCLPYSNPNYFDIKQAKKLLIDQKSNNDDDSNQSIMCSSFDSISSISSPVFINGRWCPNPPSFFIQYGLLATVQSNHIVTIYGIPCFTHYHLSNTVIPAQWTAILNLTQYLQPLQLRNNSKFSNVCNENKIILHPTCIAWFEQSFKNDNNIQYIMIGTKQGFFIQFKLTFKYHEILHNTTSNINNNNIDCGFKIEILNEFHCLNGINNVVITGIETIKFEGEHFVAISLENGSVQIWRNCNNNMIDFDCIKTIDLKSNGGISCLKWFKAFESETNYEGIYCCIAIGRQISVLHIRRPHKRLLFNQYSSSNWMNNNTSIYYPKMAISGTQFLNINEKCIILSCSYDGNINAWSMPHCTPIIKHTNNIINDPKLKEIISKSDNLYDRLIIDICHKINNQISNKLKLTPKRMTSFGIGCDPNGLLIGLIHPVPNSSNMKLSQGLQKLYLYPSSADYQTMYDLLLKHRFLSENYFQPVSVAIALDYFRSFHTEIMKQFIEYYQNVFSQWFVIITQDMNDINMNDMDIDDIVDHEDSLRFCLLMMRYFISRNESSKWLNDNIKYILETLLQIHCYKTISHFLSITNNDHNNDVNMEKEYLSIYLMFFWNATNHLTKMVQDDKNLTKIYNFLHKTLLIKLEKAFQRLNDGNSRQKCAHLLKCLYSDEDDEDDENDESDDNESNYTMNFKKIEHCPICNKLTTVAMHNGLCGSDNDKDRHLISRCCTTFRIINDYNQLHCSLCDGGTTKYITKQLLKRADDNNIDIITKCFNHCLPFICSICNVPMTQLL